MPATDATNPGPDTDRLRDALVAAGRRLGARGLISAGEGNLSVRLGGGRLLVTPSGLRKDELRADDLVIVDLDAGGAAVPGGTEPGGSPSGGAPAGGRRPTSDLAIHRAIMLARPDAGAVAHAHLPAAMALTLAGEVPDPTRLPETALFLPRLPFVPFATPGSADLASRIAAALVEPPAPLPGAVLLEVHGAVAVGEADPRTASDPTEALVVAVAQAVDRLELVEVLCRAWRDALLVRAARRE